MSPEAFKAILFTTTGLLDQSIPLLATVDAINPAAVVYQKVQSIGFELHRYDISEMQNPHRRGEIRSDDYSFVPADIALIA